MAGPQTTEEILPNDVFSQVTSRVPPTRDACMPGHRSGHEPVGQSWTSSNFLGNDPSPTGCDSRWDTFLFQYHVSSLPQFASPHLRGH